MTAQNQHPSTGLKTKRTAADPAALRRAAGILLGTPVLRADYQSTPLHGGTLGDVQLIAGDAETADGRTLPYRLVLKTQKKWERPGDLNSWRREYDLFQTDFHTLFTEAFRWPKCYDTEESQDEVRIWMEYIEGVSGAALSLDQLALAAEALGQFQHRCHRQADTLEQISCLSDADSMRWDFAQWTPDTVEYRYLRSDTCALPPDLRQMLIGTQILSSAIFRRLDLLPRVLCHRDYWTENIIVSGRRVIVLDWDCTGWGVPGEDIASLIADETPAGRIGEYYRTLLPAYYRGLGGHMPLPPMGALPVREMILFKFGYRLLQQVMFSKGTRETDEAVHALREINRLPKLRL